MALSPKVRSVCQEFEFDQIDQKRKVSLSQLGDYISNKLKENQPPKLVVICTHNSRRSHIGQIWLAVSADYYQLPDMQTFSGGTEATAFNIRAVDAFRRIGFEIIANEPKAENPVYQVRWKEGMKPYHAFSKKYEDPPNPKEAFAAIMVCAEADAGCPVVFGCDFRLALPYDDPKAFDGTELEAEKYDERVRQIGREMLFMLSKLKKKNP